MPCKVRGGLRATSHLELRQDRRHIVLHRLLRELQLLTHLPVRPSVCDERQDPFLLRGEPGEPLVLHQVLALPQPSEAGSRHQGVKKAFPSSHRSDRSNELAGSNLFQDVSGGAGHDRREEGFVIGERGKHQHVRGRMMRADLSGRLDPAPVGEPDVHHDHIRLGPVGLVDRLLDRSCLGGYVDVVFRCKHRSDAVSHYLVVVNQHHPEGWTLRLGHHAMLARASGTDRYPLVPRAGAARSPTMASATRSRKSFTVASATRERSARSIVRPIAPRGGTYLALIASWARSDPRDATSMSASRAGKRPAGPEAV